MEIFYDTSAIVPLLLVEPHSEQARLIWDGTTRAYAWKWLQVETEAALIRRKAAPSAWKNWARLQFALNFLSFSDAELTELKSFNRSVGLRAADAGHLFVLEKLTRVSDRIELASFDREMIAVARSLSIRVSSTSAT